MMKDERFGFIYKTSIEGKDLHFVGYSFIDDTDLVQSGKTGEEMEVLACRVQSAMDTWKGGLIATGGGANLKIILVYHITPMDSSSVVIYDSSGDTGSSICFERSREYGSIGSVGSE
jgi:hypothetical protein